MATSQQKFAKLYEYGESTRGPGEVNFVTEWVDNHFHPVRKVDVGSGEVTPSAEARCEADGRIWTGDHWASADELDRLYAAIIASTDIYPRCDKCGAVGEDDDESCPDCGATY